jgi:hypothetical protein
LTSDPHDGTAPLYDCLQLVLTKEDREAGLQQPYRV